MMFNALFLAALVSGIGPTAGSPGVAVLDQLIARWNSVTDYAMTLNSMETYGSRTARSVLRYTFRKPDRAKLEVLQGNSRGAVLIWQGGTDVTAYKRGLFSVVKLHAQMDDERINSLRGNGVLTPNFGNVLACFDAHRADVRALPPEQVAGQPVAAIELRYAGFICPHDSKLDSDVTRDVLFVSERTGDLVRRERFAGTALVESYDLSAMEVDRGLSDDVFK